MNKEEFFKQVLKQCFYEFVKAPASITWDNDYNILTISVKMKQYDWYIKIYDDKVILISSTGKGPLVLNSFDINEFKDALAMISDNIPF